MYCTLQGVSVRETLGTAQGCDMTLGRDQTWRVVMRLIAVVLTAVLASGNAFAEDGNILNIELADNVGAKKGTIQIELLPEIAPGHVERVKQLANEGHYDGVVFHRVIDGFMAQTGDVKFGTIESSKRQYVGMGGSDLPDLKQEFTDTPFLRGTVAMARAQDPDSANSQFFIMFGEAPFLNNNYTVFGQVSVGLDIVDSIKRGDPNRNGSVANPDYMSKVWVGRLTSSGNP